jgi:hypothetical protein
MMINLNIDTNISNFIKENIEKNEIARKIHNIYMSWDDSVLFYIIKKDDIEYIKKSYYNYYENIYNKINVDKSFIFLYNSIKKKNMNMFENVFKMVSNIEKNYFKSFQNTGG